MVGVLPVGRLYRVPVECDRRGSQRAIGRAPCILERHPRRRRADDVRLHRLDGERYAPADHLHRDAGWRKRALHDHHHPIGPHDADSYAHTYADAHTYAASVKAKAKARYLDSFSLGGVMLRELSGDRRGELIDVLNAELR
jgi:hypothetical protein